MVTLYGLNFEKEVFEVVKRFIKKGEDSPTLYSLERHLLMFVILPTKGLSHVEEEKENPQGSRKV